MLANVPPPYGKVKLWVRVAPDASVGGTAEPAARDLMSGNAALEPIAIRGVFSLIANMHTPASTKTRYVRQVGRAEATHLHLKSCRTHWTCLDTASRLSAGGTPWSDCLARRRRGPSQTGAAITGLIHGLTASARLSQGMSIENVVPAACELSSTTVPP